ncbi:MAG: hypothetical protein OXI71_03755 [Gemmatimonadota bacterium]|nr:hypothetical protein [Gemmatimonadota bacterium]
MNPLFAHNKINDDVLAVYYQLVARYMGRREVTAIDIGYIRRNGEVSQDLGVRIHVKEKFAPIHLDAREVFPDAIRDVEIDVLVSRFAHHATPVAGSYNKESERSKPHDPIRPGISVGDKGARGTIGLFVKDKEEHFWMVSCDHVIASAQRPDNDWVFQPAWSDDSAGRKVAELHRWDRPTNSAAARLVNGVRYTNVPFGWNSNQRISGVREPKLSDVLVKSGRTTGISWGVVDGIADNYDGVTNGVYIVPHDPENGGDVELSRGGDSGAIWYDPETMEAVGLHVKGAADPNPVNDYGIASTLTAVLEELGLQAP